MNEIQKYFNENGYVIINKHLPETIVNIFYSYTLKKVNRMCKKFEKRPDIFSLEWDGEFGSEVTGVNCREFYGDELTETILQATFPFMEQYTGLNLSPTYGFLRFYQKGDSLPAHTDRDSCEISTTLFIGHNVDNICSKKYPDGYFWPINIINKNNEKISISLKPGDMLVYKGIELEHFREELEANNHVQCFLHYNIVGGKYENKYDGRKNLGLPKHIKD